jgi:hypothetical protein
MLMRYLKCQAMVLLFGGIVGPIFIVVSFSMAGLGKMVSSVSSVGTTFLYLGIAITVLDVVIALAWANFSAKSAATTQQLEANGVLALANVMGMAETGMRVNEEPVLRLDLRIAGPGVNTFDVQDSVRASVTKMPMISARKLVVLVNPATNQFQIDWQRSALVAGMVPAQFSLAEDGRTYDLSGQAGPLMEIMQILKANNVPMNGTIDMRSNPVVRQEVMEVVRRAAAQQQPTAGNYPPPPPPPPPGQPAYAAAAPAPSVSQRLQELETLRATGTISDAEYTAKRQQILGEL